MSIVSSLRSASSDEAAGRLEVRPRIFRLAKSCDRAALAEVMACDERITLHDTIDRQLQELILTRYPALKGTAKELQRMAREYVGACDRDEYGVWVYFPWSSRLVHLLDEEEFIELRTDRNRNKITCGEQKMLAGRKIGIVGSSVGQSAALTLAMERGCGELRIADCGALDLSSLNHCGAGIDSIGIPTVAVTARRIAEIDPFLTVKVFFDGISEENLDRFLCDGDKLDLVIDECDSLDVKALLRYRARELRIAVLMEMSDRGLLDVERFDREPERPVFHGLIGDIRPEDLRGLGMEEKASYVIDIIGRNTISSKLRGSIGEVGRSLRRWPQLASSVMLGGALTADAARRIALGTFNDSGRYFIDLEALIADGCDPPAALDPVNGDQYQSTHYQRCRQ